VVSLRLPDRRSQPPRVLSAQGPDLGVVDLDDHPFEEGDEFRDRVQLNPAIGPPPPARVSSSSWWRDSPLTATSFRPGMLTAWLAPMCPRSRARE
jgi:hypothetical protein